jgi:glycosyltransferase involved in cell wall biosynthesis
MILLIASAGVLGGAERVLLDWAAALDRPAALACPPGPLAQAAAQARGAVPLDVVRLAERPLRRSRAPLALAGRSKEIAALARRRCPEVVVASGLRALGAAAAAPLAGAPLVALLHDLPTGAARAVQRAALTRAAAAIATSHAVADAAGGGAEVIHPGVEPGAWELADTPPGPPRALYLGALVAWKRADLALEIAARVPELQLDLAGAPLPGDPPAYAAGLRARGARPDLAGRVRFLGHVADPRPVLARAHLLLHCADREPFGLALVEALAAGRPVVAPAAGGPLEIVTPECGRLYMPGDPDAGATALRAVLADPPKGARARAAEFDGAAAARRFAAVVARIADG